jgi:GNAT superfamily N-acetyltransferase
MGVVRGATPLQGGGRTGFFGWFEAIHDQSVAEALFTAAGEWLRQKGRDRMQGPFNFNINDECGLLVNGFDTPPMLMMTHNPPYYQRLFEAAGLVKAQDLYAYRLDATAEAPADVVKFAQGVRARPDVVVRPWNMKDFQGEMRRWLEVYNSAWEKNWGSIKMTEAEFMAHALELRWLADPELLFMAETKDGEVMGCAMTLPNLNEYLKTLNGHLYNLLPFRWFDMIVKKKYRSCRVVTLGVKEQFRRSGVGAVFYHDTLMAAKRRGYEWGEMSWILESNDAMNRAILHMGGQVYKTYRIYEKAL